MTEPNDQPILKPEDQIQSQQDVIAAYEMERILLDGPRRSEYRRTRHAFRGALARIRDMSEETDSFWATISTLLNVDLHAARLEAFAFVTGLQQTGKLPADMTAAASWELASQFLAFAGQTIYSGYLSEQVYSDAWIQEYEKMKAAARAQPDQGGPQDMGEDIF